MSHKARSIRVYTLATAVEQVIMHQAGQVHFINDTAVQTAHAFFVTRCRQHSAADSTFMCRVDVSFVVQS
jgi:hypothetical protein